MSIGKLKINALFYALKYCSTWNIFYIIYTSNILNKEKKLEDKKTKTRILKPQLLDEVEKFADEKTFTFTMKDLRSCYKERKNMDRNFNSPFLKMLIAKGE